MPPQGSLHTPACAGGTGSCWPPARAGVALDRFEVYRGCLVLFERLHLQPVVTRVPLPERPLTAADAPALQQQLAQARRAALAASRTPQQDQVGPACCVAAWPVPATAASLEAISEGLPCARCFPTGAVCAACVDAPGALPEPGARGSQHPGGGQLAPGSGLRA